MKPSTFYSLLSLLSGTTAMLAYLHGGSAAAVIIGTVNGVVMMAASTILREMGR